MGGQESSAKVIKGMLKRSLFVEEAARSLGVANRKTMEADSLNRLFVEPVAEFIDEWYGEFRSHVEGWCDSWLEGGAQFVTWCRCACRDDKVQVCTVSLHLGNREPNRKVAMDMVGSACNYNRIKSERYQL